MRSRSPGLLVLGASALLTATVVAAGVARTPAATPVVVRREAGAAGVAEARVAEARQVLRHWDKRRALAWARADVAGLRALYTPGSLTGRRDAAMLAAYRHHGLRVTRMTRQVLRFRLVEQGQRRLSLLVTDRLVDARLVGRGVAAALPDGRAATRRVRLVRAGGTWRVCDVADVPAQPAR